MPITSIKSRGSMKNNRGFTILEAIIGFLILSIGMLGIASLNAVSLQAGKSAIYSSVAIMKVDEIFESMRANSGALDSYIGTGTGGAPCTATDVCTGARLASDDLYWWSKNLKAGLPDAATVQISVVSPVAPLKMAAVTVVVTWSERSDASSTSEARTYTAITNICTANPC